MKVDPETGEMLDDSPDNPDPDQRGGMLPGDPGLKGASESGQDSGIVSKLRPGPDGEDSGTQLGGEQETRE